MIKVADVVRNIVYSSEVALTALGGGYLNLSAYAKTIKEEVEGKSKKPVKIGSIVTALSRLRETIQKSEPLLPEVIIEDLSVKSGLVEIAFDKTREGLAKLPLLYRDPQLNTTDFLVVTQGTGEINITVLSGSRGRILSVYKPQAPKAVIENLVSITARFSEEYINIPNIIYALVRNFALKRINIVELVSTYTELTFVLHQSDLQTAFLILNGIFKKEPQKS